MGQGRLLLALVVLAAVALVSGSLAATLEGDAANSDSTATINDPPTTVPRDALPTATAVMIEPTAEHVRNAAVNTAASPVPALGAATAVPGAAEPPSTASPAFPPEEYQPTNPEAAAAFPEVTVISAESLLAGGISAQSVFKPSAADLAAVAAKMAGPVRR